MTTTVRVNAHCPENYEVVVRVDDGECNTLSEQILPNGDETTVYVSGEQTLMVWERQK